MSAGRKCDGRMASVSVEVSTCGRRRRLHESPGWLRPRPPGRRGGRHGWWSQGTSDCCCWRASEPHPAAPSSPLRSEEHTSELQSRFDLVCRLLLEKKKEK